MDMFPDHADVTIKSFYSLTFSFTLSCTISAITALVLVLKVIELESENIENSLKLIFHFNLIIMHSLTIRRFAV